MKSSSGGWKYAVRTLHLWFGLLSGIIVFIIAITGCIYAFQEEIQNATQSYRFVESKREAFVLPSTLRSKTEALLPGKNIHAILYRDGSRAAEVILFNAEPAYFYMLYFNPYTGELLKLKDMETDFFHFVLDGHFYLWLPPMIGQPVVAVSTLIFFVMIISGIVLWWPSNKNAIRQRFTIKWKASTRRRNFDLHSVLGFYACVIALVFVITGLVWGFQWFAKGLYKVSGGSKEITYSIPQADTTVIHTDKMDELWLKLGKQFPAAASLEIHTPVDGYCYAVNVNPSIDTYWKTDYRYYDPQSLEEIPVSHIYGRYQDADSADKLLRMNYDIHTGAILGFAGKLLAFCASLVIASLPVTGFLVWYWRKYGKKAKLTKRWYVSTKEDRRDNPKTA